MISHDKEETETKAPGDDSRGSVEPLGTSELREAAALHLAGLPEEFVSRLGERFVARLYRAYAEGEHARVLGVRDPRTGSLAGVVAGATDAARHYPYLVRRHGAALAFEALLAAARSPRLGADLVRTRLLRYVRGLGRTLLGGREKEPSGGDGRDGGSGEGPVGFVVYVAVRPEHRRSGTGRALLEAFETECRRAGSRRADAAAIPGSAGERFFLSLGWELSEVRRSRSGEPYALFTKPLGA